MTFTKFHGDHPGQNTARTMIDAVGGAGSIRTRIETRPDGSTVMLRTRGGNPEITVTTPPVKKALVTDLVEQAYALRTFYGSSEDAQIGMQKVQNTPLIGSKDLLFYGVSF